MLKAILMKVVHGGTVDKLCGRAAMLVARG